MTATLGEVAVRLFPTLAGRNAAPLLGPDSHHPEDR